MLDVIIITRILSTMLYFNSGTGRNQLMLDLANKVDDASGALSCSNELTPCLQWCS